MDIIVPMDMFRIGMVVESMFGLEYGFISVVGSNQAVNVVWTRDGFYGTFPMTHFTTINHPIYGTILKVQYPHARSTTDDE